MSLNKMGIQARKHLASNPAITLPSRSSPVPLKPAVPLCFSGRQPVMLAGIIHNFLASCTLISGRFFTSKDSNEFTSFHQYNRICIKHWENYLTSASVPFVKER